MKYTKVTESVLKALRERCRLLEDSNVPGEPPWHNDARIAFYCKGYTGYVNSTPVPTWTYDQKLAFWKRRQIRANNELARALGEMPPPKNLKRVLRKTECAHTGEMNEILTLLTARANQWIPLQKLPGNNIRVSIARLRRKGIDIRSRWEVIAKSCESGRRHGRRVNTEYMLYEVLESSLPAPSTTEGEGNVVKKETENDCTNYGTQSTNPGQSEGEPRTVLQ